MKSIFVMIASYRDAECEPTIIDLYETASGNYKINVGVVWQIHDERIPNLLGFGIKNRVISAAKSLGCCWARSLAYEMYSGENYLFSIDSHSRFEQNWDMSLVNMLESLPQKSVISTYPASYTPQEGKSIAVPHTIVPGDYINGILVPKAIPCDARIIEQYLVSAGFIFSRGFLFKEVPYDKSIYFNGEEPTLALRLWTHGWTIYSPGKVVMYHYYNRINTNRHWLDFEVKDLIDKSNKRVYAVMSGSCFDRFGIGSTRSYHDYMELSKIRRQK